MRVKVYVIYVAAPDVDVGGQRRLRDQWILSEVYIDDDALEGHYVYGFVSLTIQPRRNTSRYTVRGYGQIYYSESEFDRFEFMLSGSPPPPGSEFFWSFTGAGVFVDSGCLLDQFYMVEYGSTYPQHRALWPPMGYSFFF
ncbi:hypothetical protein HPP92_001783 [Vanilla planifolia]|uniref:Uncharacterized protein n=1 Tax=Vanilla planifolia TaxID=51239 RepID=A0A835S0I7_VANPL|nr:hypothetical protein HPP92_001783 [Vanilla planifolia]